MRVNLVPPVCLYDAINPVYFPLKSICFSVLILILLNGTTCFDSDISGLAFSPEHSLSVLLICSLSLLTHKRNPNQISSLIVRFSGEYCCTRQMS